jgi:hypothetical protein
MAYSNLSTLVSPYYEYHNIPFYLLAVGGMHIILGEDDGLVAVESVLVRLYSIRRGYSS